jgi:transposase-like protein
MTEPKLVCPQCGLPVDRHVVWRKSDGQHIRYECKQHQTVVPVVKETTHE